MHIDRWQVCRMGVGECLFHRWPLICFIPMWPPYNVMLRWSLCFLLNPVGLWRQQRTLYRIQRLSWKGGTVSTGASWDAHSCDPAPVLWGSPEAACRGMFPPRYQLRSLTTANVNCQASKPVKQAFRGFQPLTWRWHQVEQRAVPTKTCSHCRFGSKISILALSQYFGVVYYTTINNQNSRQGPLWHWAECS